MKICWDNINELRYNKKTQKWYKDRYNNGKVIGTNPYILRENCIVCSEDFLSAVGNKGKCCSLSCNTTYRNSTVLMKEETKKKISKAKIGKKVAPDVVAKMKYRPQNQRWKGRGNPVYDPILKEKRRKTVIERGVYKGENNPRWKGGCDKNWGYSWDFRHIREEILERDNNTCLNPACKRLPCRIEVHHIDYNKENNSSENLITLCKSCNNLANFNKEWHTKWYKLVMEKRCHNVSKAQEDKKAI